LLSGVGESSGFDLEQIDQAMQRSGVEQLLGDIEHGCRNLELAGILKKQGWNYNFAIPVFPHVLAANYNVDFLLRKIRSEGI